MSEPTRAVVQDGAVTNVVLMDDATAAQWAEAGHTEQLWPGGELVDVTDADPRPGVGWAWDGQAFTPPEEPEPEPPTAEPEEKPGPKK